MHGISPRRRHLPIFICITYSSVITIKISFNITIPPIPCFVSTFSFRENKPATKCTKEYSGDYICTVTELHATVQYPDLEIMKGVGGGGGARSKIFSFGSPFSLKIRGADPPGLSPGSATVLTTQLSTFSFVYPFLY